MASRRADHGPVLVIPKQSLLERFAGRHPDPRFVAHLERGSSLVRNVRAAHQQNREALHVVVEAARALGVAVEVCEQPTRRQAARARLVVSVGGDGTLLDVAHRVADRPVLGVNSNPTRSVGHFCGATAADVGTKLAAIFVGSVTPTEVNRMAIEVNGRRYPHLAMNDVLFAHRCPAAITDYRLVVEGVEEEQRSSGVWLATGAGSTGAIRAAGGLVQPVSARTIQYLVREPYTPRAEGVALTRGLVEGPIEVRARSFDAALFIDGHRLQRRLGFGDRVRFALSDQPLRLYRC